MSICKKSKVALVTKTLEKIVNEPEWILENEEVFWEQERAQKLTKKWADAVNYEIPLDKWRKQVKEWADLPREEREAHSFMKITQEIVSGIDPFLEKALPHICSFLPDEADINVTLQFSAFLPTTAFAMEDIVVNVAAPNWNNNIENILNLVVHEIFHAGYSYCRDIQTEEKPPDESLYKMLDNFFSEGICTYVGYKALPVFPAPDDKDYPQIRDIAEVKRLFGDVNEVFSQVGKIPDEELQKLSWEKCVIGRGYYVVGAFMCKVIDNGLGRDALIQMLTTGPAYWIKQYNAIAPEGLKIILAVEEITSL